MASYKISSKANQDIDEIWWYGLKRWSLSQADLYQEGLYAHLQQIADGIAHRSVFDAASGVWSSLYQAHVICFEFLGKTAYVLRILHGAQRQNID